MFRYYLLGGDTAAPSGLYTRLCHAFLFHTDPHLGCRESSNSEERAVNRHFSAKTVEMADRFFTSALGPIIQSYLPGGVNSTRVCDLLWYECQHFKLCHKLGYYQCHNWIILQQNNYFCKVTVFGRVQGVLLMFLYVRTWAEKHCRMTTGLWLTRN